MGRLLARLGLLLLVWTTTSCLTKKSTDTEAPTTSAESSPTEVSPVPVSYPDAGREVVVETPAPQPVERDACETSGCSGTGCGAKPGKIVCSFLPHYDCYQRATCERAADGECQWTPTAQLRACLIALDPQQFLEIDSPLRKEHLPLLREIHEQFKSTKIASITLTPNRCRRAPRAAIKRLKETTEALRSYWSDNALTVVVKEIEVNTLTKCDSDIDYFLITPS